MTQYCYDDNHIDVIIRMKVILNITVITLFHNTTTHMYTATLCPLHVTQNGPNITCSLVLITSAGVSRPAAGTSVRRHSSLMISRILNSFSTKLLIATVNETL